MSNFKAARALGWTSIAVGTTELLATRRLQYQMGISRHDALIRAFGLREIASGTSILSQIGIKQGLASALWSRVLGDLMDIVALGAAAPFTRRPKGLAAVAGIVIAVTGLDILVASRVQEDVRRASRVSRAAKNRVQATAAVPNGAAAVEPQVQGTLPVSRSERL
jgi:hypothetical protein